MAFSIGIEEIVPIGRSYNVQEKSVHSCNTWDRYVWLFLYVKDVVP